MVKVHTFIEFAREGGPSWADYKFQIQTVKPPVELDRSHGYDLKHQGQCVMHYLDWVLPRVYYTRVIDRGIDG